MLNFTAEDARKLVDDYKARLDREAAELAQEWVSNDVVPNIKNCATNGYRHLEIKSPSKESVTIKAVELLKQSQFIVSRVNAILVIKW